MGIIKKYFENRRLEEISRIVRQTPDEIFDSRSPLELFRELESQVVDYAWSVVTGITVVHGKYADIVHQSDHRIFSDKQRNEIDHYVKAVIKHGPRIENLDPVFLKDISKIDVLKGRKYDIQRLDVVVVNAHGLADDYIGFLITVNGKSTAQIASELNGKYESIMNNDLFKIYLDQKKVNNGYFIGPKPDFQ